MGKRQVTVLECDYPGCGTNTLTDKVEPCQLGIGDKGVKRPLLCTPHRGLPFQELYDKVPMRDGRRRRGVQVTRPEDIPHLPK